jgi:hypothetical protein
MLLINSYKTLILPYNRLVLNGIDTNSENITFDLFFEFFSG